MLVTVNNGPARLLRNDGPPATALRVALRGKSANRDGIGAKVALQLAGGARPWRMVKTGSSYLSQSELPVTFGLGAAPPKVEAIEVTWPGGRVEKLPPEPAGQTLVIEEGRGVVERVPFAARPATSTAARR